VERRAKIFFCGERATAFTLLEVIVTLTILGFILLMIFGVFRLGIAAWKKGETNKEEYQRTRIASQLISRQMKSALPYKVKTQKAEGDFLAFEGKAHSLKFVSTLSLRASKPSGLVYAFYEFQEDGKGGGRLVLYEGRVLNKNFLEDNPPEDKAVPIFEGLADVRFEYYREEDPEKTRAGGWEEEWNAKEENALPTALRVTLSPQKGGGRAEGASLVILASLPANRYENVRTGPVRRMVRPVAR
jgi:general secretion pathway protein J